MDGDGLLVDCGDAYDFEWPLCGDDGAMCVGDDAVDELGAVEHVS